MDIAPFNDHHGLLVANLGLLHELLGKKIQQL